MLAYLFEQCSLFSWCHTRKQSQYNAVLSFAPLYSFAICQSGLRDSGDNMDSVANTHDKAQKGKKKWETVMVALNMAHTESHSHILLVPLADYAIDHIMSLGLNSGREVVSSHFVKDFKFLCGTKMK